MRKNEKELFFELCNFTAAVGEGFKASLEKYATASVLGHLFYNRMQAVAYGVLEKNGLLGSVNREFRTSLQGAYEQNVVKNESFFRCVELLSEVLSPCEGKYAMLKGALLCKLYPKGYRTSNDIDLLVSENDVTTVANRLLGAGFKQGNIRNGDFVPATRKEIIESKMMRGETVPFVKQVDLPNMKYLEVDINFSVDYKNGDKDTVADMLSKAKRYTIDDISVVTLREEDFFIHLCGHLYKEATTLPWILMKRDMTLYKYLDINLLLHRFSKADIKRIFKRAEELGMSGICACVIVWTEELIPSFNKDALAAAEKALAGKEELLLTVVSPAEKKTYYFEEESAAKRFFDDDRGKRLRRSKK